MVPQDTLEPPVIGLLTDFGLSDTYVAQIKAVMHGFRPDDSIIDISHDVPPQDVLAGAYLLETASRSFRRDVIRVAVVDPGVGTSRRRLVVRSGGEHGSLFVGPDNGLLSCALPAGVRSRRRLSQPYAASQVSLPPEIVAVSIESGVVTPSATFEGRDVFAQVAMQLATGARSLDDLGPRVGSMLAFPQFRAPLAADGSLEGLVLHVDRFGNLITDIHGADLAPNPRFDIAGRRLPLARTYAEGSGLCAIVSSAATIEIALPNGSAAATLGIGRGARVTAR
jgi:S-adenosylmethionine hydrolase